MKKPLTSAEMARRRIKLMGRKKWLEHQQLAGIKSALRRGHILTPRSLALAKAHGLV